MIPKGSFVLALKPGEKVPDPTINPNGSKDAQPAKPKGRPKGNYGIRLDAQYIVVDIDCDHSEREEFESALPPTWSQRTARADAVGMHYLYRVPEGYIGSGKRVWNGRDGKKIADIKAKGYIVGPGSVVSAGTYTMVNEVEPAPAPQWVLDFCAVSKSEETNAISATYDGIPNGEHDSFLSTLTYWLSTRWGLSEEANKVFLREGPLAVLEGTDPSNPYSESDLARLAHSGASKGTSKPLQLVEEDDEGWDPEIDLNMPKVTWVLQDFVPRGNLVLQYGAGGIGKSTWISWLASQAAKRGLSFGVASIEESVKRFKVRSFLSDPELGLDVHRIVNIGNSWKFPRDAEKFREKLIKYPLDIIYFDAIYAHFENGDSYSNAAEKARACLSPLSTIAQDLNVTIIGTLHEGKNKDYLGSTEIENVCRVFLHATRSGNKPLKIRVKKTNYTQPEHSLNMIGTKLGAVSPEGNPWLEETEDGVESQTQLYVVTGCEKSSGEEEIELEMPQESEKDIRNRKVLEMIDQGSTSREIAKELGISLDTISRIRNNR